MAQAITYMMDSNARVKRVYYEETSTIYEGMPVCYNFNTTDNTSGYGAATFGASKTYQGTTAEGEQNEGKFIRVENPTTGNLMFFAGVVVGNENEGQAGPTWLDIYVADDGVIVPVRSYISSTVGVSALAIMNGQQYFGNPNAGMSNGAARYVAVAEETVNRSSVVGLCLAKLCPNQFLGQSAGTTKLNFATAGTVEVAANLINVQSSQTTGTFTALFVRSQVATADSGDVALAIYGEANLTGVAAGSYCIGNRTSLNIWGGTQTAIHIHALAAEIYEESANLTGGTYISPLMLRTQIDAANPPAANSHWMITCRCDGADKPDGLLIAVSADAIKFAAQSSAAISHTIPIRVAGTTYYIMVSSAA